MKHRICVWLDDGEERRSILSLQQPTLFTVNITCNASPMQQAPNLVLTILQLYFINPNLIDMWRDEHCHQS
jgi:hypothetical protein